MAVVSGLYQAYGGSVQVSECYYFMKYEHGEVRCCLPWIDSAFNGDNLAPLPFPSCMCCISQAHRKSQDRFHGVMRVGYAQGHPPKSKSEPHRLNLAPASNGQLRQTLYSVGGLQTTLDDSGFDQHIWIRYITCVQWHRPWSCGTLGDCTTLGASGRQDGGDGSGMTICSAEQR
jgi:hypothetical protein